MAALKWAGVTVAIAMVLLVALIRVLHRLEGE